MCAINQWQSRPEHFFVRGNVSSQTKIAAFNASLERKELDCANLWAELRGLGAIPVAPVKNVCTHDPVRHFV